jgi:hypothetical protein
MGLCGVLQILLTLPFVGVHSWFEWYDISREGARSYNKWPGWVSCARDLNSLPRQVLIDWKADHDAQDKSLSFEMTLITYVLIATFFEATIRLTALRMRGRRSWIVPGAAFLLIGLWFCCWRITYYDTLLVALPAALLLCVPAPVTVPFFVYRSRPLWTFGGAELRLPLRRFGLVCNPLVVGLLPIMVWEPSWWGVPWIQALFALLWLWAGWLWLRSRDPAAAAVAAAPPATAAVEAAVPSPRVILAAHPS